jgi:signal transduction histidine kinase
VTSDVGCIFTKGLIPWVEREVGPDGVAAIVALSGRSREYLTAEYNTIPFSVADELVRLCMRLMNEPDEERWARRFAEDFMDWKPTRKERAWGGAYTMSLGSPRAIYGKPETAWPLSTLARFDLLRIGRTSATYRITPFAGVKARRWVCTWPRVCFERYPMNWGLPRAVVTERACAAQGAPACEWDIRWKNPPLGAGAWTALGTGAVGSALTALAVTGAAPLPAAALAAGLPVLVGSALGYGLVKERRRRHLARMLDVIQEEVLYSSGELERKFRDLESKVQQLSLLTELSQAVNATLDPERIYEQALDRLVEGMAYQAAYLLLVDEPGRVLRVHRARSRLPVPAAAGVSLDAAASVSAKVATTGVPVVVNDVEDTTEPVFLPQVQALGVRAFVCVPLRQKARVIGILNVVSSQPHRFTPGDAELLAAVANHVALAIDKAESFRTIEDLSRGLEDKVRVRTEQLRATNEELQGAYRELQATQMQLVQREKMASVGQLVAGVAHELNNPIGFVASNAATLEDFVGRLRAMLEAYRARASALPAPERGALQAEWEQRKVDYVLRYLDSMIQGIREGAERTRKIVRDLRVFARGDDDVWQAVDLHDEVESSLTLLGPLLKDRVVVHRKYGELPSVVCVRSQIDQVLLNLLANAAQAIEGPGAITLETRLEGDQAVLTIADTGRGIAPEVRGRIFDPFFTTKPLGEGTGLGLSITYEIVKKHGGEIGVDSRPREGATFTVRLPVDRAR